MGLCSGGGCGSGGIGGGAQLFWARIKDNKAILRYKNFQSAALAEF